MMDLKNLVISQIKARLSQANVEELYLCFNVNTGESVVKIKEINDPVQYDILLQNSESRLLKGIFVTKVLKEAKKDFPNGVVTSIIVKAHLINESLDLFLVFFDDIIQPFKF